MKPHGRAIVCGVIFDYQADVPSAEPNWISIIKRRLTVQGFAMPDHFGDVQDLVDKLTFTGRASRSAFYLAWLK